VIFDEKSNFREHMPCKTVGLIIRNFKYMSLSSFVLVYKNLLISKLVVRNCVWKAYRKSDIE